jgi:hypothetical protein
MIDMEGSAGMPEGSRKDGLFWTFTDVEERMVEAIGFLDRVSPSGRNPFATDGPWAQIRRAYDAGAQTRDDVADYVPDLDAVREREAQGRGGLRAAEVDRMEQALEWITLVQDRKGRLRPLVGVVLQQKVKGGSQVDWAEVKRRLRSSDSHDCLRVSYSRAIGRIAATLNQKRVPVSY